MGEFSPAWLALREPADRAARSARLVDALFTSLRNAAGILDLACGTGSNMRYLRDRRADFDWLLVDHDTALLALVPAAPNVRVLARDLRSLDDQLFEGRALVTASALLDLVSDDWIDRLARHCHRQHSAILFALTYDGRIACRPEDPDDSTITGLVNRHQKTDKGFGPALGPDAVACAVRTFSALGYSMRVERSDWVLDGSSELQQQLLAGWAEAAVQVAPEHTTLIDAWHARRLEHVDRGRSTLTVGHQDVSGIVG